MPDRALLVDTSAWIEALRPAGNAPVRTRVAALLADGRVVTTQMVVMELLSGARSEEQYDELFEDLSAIPVLAVETSTWMQATRLGFDLRRIGLSIPPTDLLIASVAMANHVAVLHVDRHFDLVASNSPLQVESMIGAVVAKP